MARKPYHGKLSGILLARGVITEEALEAASEEAAGAGARLEKFLVDNRLVRGPDMTLALSEYLGMSPISLAHFTPGKLLLDLIPTEIMQKRMLVPIARLGKTLTVALADPFDLMAIDELNTLTGLHITPLTAVESEIQALVSRLSTESTQDLNMEELMRDDSEVEVMDEEKDEQSLDEMLESAEGAPVIRMVNMILVEALRTGASDIHIEPMERKVRLRYRIDGELTERPGPPKNLQSAVVSRIKIMSDMDIAERRVPQDGRFNIKALGKEVDLRVSTLPTVHGEKVVMRTLDKTTLAPSL